MNNTLWEIERSQIRVSKSHDCATAQFFSDFLQNLEICMHKLKSYACLPLLKFLSACFTHIKWFLVIFFTLFLAQSFKFKVLTAQKNILLECLTRICWIFCINFSLHTLNHWNFGIFWDTLLDSQPIFTGAEGERAVDYKVGQYRGIGWGIGIRLGQVDYCPRGMFNNEIKKNISLTF